MALKNYRPKYNPGDIVYAISFSNEDTTSNAETVPEFECNYARIYKVEIVSVYINKESIEYLLRDLKGKKEEWGCDVLEEHISKNINNLYKYLNNKWKL